MIRSLPSLLLVLTLSACATTSFKNDAAPMAERLPPAARLIPLKVGVYVTPEAEAFVHHAKIPLGEWTYAFGAQLAGLTQQTLAQVFEDVRIVRDRSQPGLDLLIQPKLDESATNVQISFSAVNAAATVAFEVFSWRGPIWKRTFSADASMSGSRDDMPRHGQAVAKAVAAGAAAMRADMANKEFITKARRPRPKSEVAGE